MIEQLIKSKERVQTFGEVFTPIFIVKKMLLEVEGEIKNLETKFLEPSAGEGAFLCELLRQRLNFFKDGDEKILLTALANIYGIEFLQENVSGAHKGMKKIFREFCRDEKILQTADLIIEKNIVCADALELENILFGDWQFFPTVRTIFKFKKSIQQSSFEEENFMAEKKSSLVILGNPPYQKDIPKDSDNKTFAAPIYHKFLEKAWESGDKVIMIHPARCLFNAGATPKDFNKKLLSNPHIKVVDYEPDSSKYFPNTDIKGGVAVTLFDKEKNFGAIDTFTPFPELNSILHKVVVNNENFSPLSEIVFGRMQYRLTEKFFIDNPNANFSNDRQRDFFKSNVFTYAKDYFFDEKPNDGEKYFQVLGIVKGERIFKFFRADWLNIGENKINFDKYKIFVPEANGSGAIGEVLSTPLVGLPLVGCTQTFITVGAFDSETEARACLAYIKSKFCRAMLGVLKVTQHNPPQTWAKVPMQDFSADSDIDWSKNISEIDAQLYEKYSLSAEEIKFIEEKVRAME